MKFLTAAAASEAAAAAAADPVGFSDADLVAHIVADATVPDHETLPTLQAPLPACHGRSGDPSWAPPYRVVECDVRLCSYSIRLVGYVT